MSERHYDAIVIGAGAAGLMCAIAAGQRGLRVLVVDHANKVGKKILMSGGGRCNFTNTGTTPANYLSANPHFCKSALARYAPADFIDMVERHRVAYHEKELGQLFCDVSSKLIVKMLLDECAATGVEVRTHCTIERVGRGDDGAGLLLIQQAKPLVDHRRRALDQRQRVDDLARLALARDVEVLQRALRLRAPQPVGRHVDRAEGVALGARGGVSVGHGAACQNGGFRHGSRATMPLAPPPAFTR